MNLIIRLFQFFQQKKNVSYAVLNKIFLDKEESSSGWETCRFFAKYLSSVYIGSSSNVEDDFYINSNITS